MRAGSSDRKEQHSYKVQAVGSNPTRPTPREGGVMIEWLREQARRYSTQLPEKATPSPSGFIDWLEKTGATPTIDVAEQMYIEAAIAAL